LSSQSHEAEDGNCKEGHQNYGYLLRFCVTDVKGTREKPPPREMDGLITQYMRWVLVLGES